MSMIDLALRLFNQDLPRWRQRRQLTNRLYEVEWCILVVLWLVFVLMQK